MYVLQVTLAAILVYFLEEVSYHSWKYLISSFTTRSLRLRQEKSCHTSLLKQLLFLIFLVQNRRRKSTVGHGPIFLDPTHCVSDLTRPYPRLRWNSGLEPTRTIRPTAFFGCQKYCKISMLHQIVFYDHTINLDTM